VLERYIFQGRYRVTIKNWEKIMNRFILQLAFLVFLSLSLSTFFNIGGNQCYASFFLDEEEEEDEDEFDDDVDDFEDDSRGLSADILTLGNILEEIEEEAAAATLSNLGAESPSTADTTPTSDTLPIVEKEETTPTDATQPIVEKEETAPTEATQPSVEQSQAAPKVPTTQPIRPAPHELSEQQ
jgi:hypothetical protein